MRRQMTERRRRFEMLSTKLTQLDPRLILSRGYAIVLNDQNQIVRDATDAPVGSDVSIMLAKDGLTARVTAVDASTIRNLPRARAKRDHQAAAAFEAILRCRRLELLFCFIVTSDDRLTMQPVLPRDGATPFHASLGPDGRLWIPADLRKTVSLGEQSVMLRIENGAIGMYLRKRFRYPRFSPLTCLWP